MQINVFDLNCINPETIKTSQLKQTTKIQSKYYRGGNEYLSKGGEFKNPLQQFKLLTKKYIKSKKKM